MTEPSIHGHEVIALLVDSGRAWTRDELLAELATRFGPQARYHTCGDEGMNADQLLDFLQARGKFIPSAHGLRIDPEKICQHD